MTTDTDNAIEIVVRDKGIGIPEKMHSKVFGKFFRIRNGDIHNVKGFGLGLSFVKTVIQSHRGSIDLLSKVNQGTEVRITLPQT
jgi:two-component system phosphate regulon sensor histidine kinase PhoR